MTAAIIDFVAPFNRLRAGLRGRPLADWGPVEYRSQAVGYAIARGAMVYVWPHAPLGAECNKHARRVGRLIGTETATSAAMLRVQFATGSAAFPCGDVHPIPFCLQFKPQAEIEEFILAESAETFTAAPIHPFPDPPHGGHAA